MTKLLKLLMFWKRRPNHAREWYRRQEEAIRPGASKQDTERDPNAAQS
jgi:hypothetical protein